MSAANEEQESNPQDHFELLDNDEAIPFLSVQEDDIHAKYSDIRHNGRDRVYRLLSICMLLTSMVLLAATLRFPTKEQCTRQMSAWSPMLDAVQHAWRRFKTEPPNPYVGKPNQDLESAWGKLWEYGSIGIPDPKLPLLNKSREVDWKYQPDDLGGGVVAFIEGFHQIHCVHLLRQYSYRDEFDYSDNPAFLRQEDVFYNHVDHCIQVLRINLMCNADVTPYLVEEGENGGTVVHTDAMYRCRKFDEMVAWAEREIVQPYNVTEERLRTIEEVEVQKTSGMNIGHGMGENNHSGDS